jgi:hypothetical protein
MNPPELLSQFYMGTKPIESFGVPTLTRYNCVKVGTPGLEALKLCNAEKLRDLVGAVRGVADVDFRGDGGLGGVALA